MFIYIYIYIKKKKLKQLKKYKIRILFDIKKIKKIPTSINQEK
jgi:hypothetical protein